MRKGNRVRDKDTGQFVSSASGRSHGHREVVRTAKGETLHVYRDRNSGRYTTQKSAERIGATTKRAADSLRRLAKR
jgi:hypothetical protein